MLEERGAYGNDPTASSNRCAEWGPRSCVGFRVGSRCANFENFVQAFNIEATVLREANTRGHEIKILDTGSGFPVAYDRHAKPFRLLASMSNAGIDRLFPRDV